MRAFSPPESRIMFCSFLPGGWAMMRTPASRISSPFHKLQLAVSAAEELAESLVKLRLDLDKVFFKLPAHACVQVVDDTKESFFALYQIVVLAF